MLTEFSSARGMQRRELRRTSLTQQDGIRTDGGTRRLRISISQTRWAKLRSFTVRRTEELMKMLPMSMLMKSPAAASLH